MSYITLGNSTLGNFNLDNPWVTFWLLYHDNFPIRTSPCSMTGGWGGVGWGGGWEGDWWMKEYHRKKIHGEETTYIQHTTHVWTL